MQTVTDLSNLDYYTQKIKKYSNECTKAFFNVAYCLYEVKEYGYFKDKYNDVFEYAEHELGYKKRTVYNFLNVVDKFALRDSDNLRPKMFIAEEYKDYNFSQLVEILSLKSKGDVKEIKPTMSAREVKTKVKELNQVANEIFEEKENIVEVKFQEVEKILS